MQREAQIWPSTEHTQLNLHCLPGSMCLQMICSNDPRAACERGGYLDLGTFLSEFIRGRQKCLMFHLISTPSAFNKYWSLPKWNYVLNLLFKSHASSHQDCQVFAPWWLLLVAFRTWTLRTVTVIANNQSILNNRGWSQTSLQKITLMSQLE